MGTLCFSSLVVTCRSASERQNQIIPGGTFKQKKADVRNQKDKLAYVINASDDLNLDTALGVILLFSCVTPNSNTTAPPLVINILPKWIKTFKFL